MIRVTMKENLQPLKDLARRARELEGGRNVPVTELLRPEFLSSCSRFATADQMFEASGFQIESAEDFKAIPDAEWDAFIPVTSGSGRRKSPAQLPTVPSLQQLDRLVVKSGGTTRFIRVADIDWIEGAGVYANLHVGGKELLYRSALCELADTLDPIRFVRVHRSVIVNIDSIVQLQPMSHGEFELVLKDGHRSRVSRTYRPHLEKRLGQFL